MTDKKQNSSGGSGGSSNSQMQGSKRGGSSSSIQMTLLKLWLSFHPTVSTLLLAYFLTTSLHQIVIISSDSNAISLTYYYALLIITPLGLIIWVITSFMSMQLARVPLIQFNDSRFQQQQTHATLLDKDAQVTWGSTHSSMDYMREVFKILVVLQNFYLKRLGINESGIGHSLHSLVLLLICLSYCTYKTRRFFIETIDSVAKFLDMLVLSASMLFFIRVVIKAELLILILLQPIIILGVYSFLSKMNSGKSFTSILSIIQQRKMAGFVSIKAFIELAHLVRKLNTAEHETSSEAADRLMSHQDIILMMTIFTQHRRICLRDTCLCKNYAFHCFGQFQLTSAQAIIFDRDSAQSAQNVQNSIVKTRSEKSHPKKRSKPENEEVDMLPLPKILSKTHLVKVGPADQIQEEDQDENFKKFEQLPTTPVIMQNKTDIIQNAEEGQQNESFQKGGDLSSRQFELDGTLAPTLISGGINLPSFKSQNAAGDDAVGEPQNLSTMLMGTPSRDKDGKNLNNFDEIAGQPQLDTELLSQMCDEDEFMTEIEVQKAIVKYGFKSTNEAKSYIFKYLIGLILQDYQSNVANNRALQSTEESIWYDLQISYMSYLINVMKKPFKAVSELIKIKYSLSQDMSGKRVLGTFAQLRFNIAERVLMRQVQIHLDLLKTKDQVVNPALQINKYIQMSEKQTLLETILNHTTSKVNDFWAKWSSQTTNLEEIFKVGTQASKLVLFLRSLSLEEEIIQCSESSKLNRLIDFFQLIIKDGTTARYICQIYQSQSKGRFTSSKRSITIANEASMNYSIPLILVKPEYSGDNLSFKFDLINEQFEQLIGSRGKKLIGQDIKVVMPLSLAFYHDQLIKKFFSKGKADNQLFGKHRTVLLKDFLGFIKLVKFKLDFSFNHKSGSYQFIATFEEVYEWKEGFMSNSSLSIDNCLFFITNENHDIIEISQAVVSKCGFEKLQTYSQVEEIQCRSLNFQQFAPDLVHLLDYLPNKSNSSQIQQAPVIKNHISRILKCDEQKEGLDQKKYFVGVVSSFQNCFKSTMGEKCCYLQGFQVVPLACHPDQEGILHLSYNQEVAEKYCKIENAESKFGGANRYKCVQTALLSSKKSNEHNTNSLQKQSSDHSDRTDDVVQFEMSSQNSLSAVQSSHAQASMIQNILFSKRTPRYLKIVAFILGLMILSFVTICIYNLIVFTQKHDYISQRVQAYNYAGRALISFRKTTLQLQTIHQLILIEKNQSSKQQAQILAGFLTQFAVHKKDSADVEDKFELLVNKNPGLFSYDLRFENAQYLSDEGLVYYRNLTLKHYQQLYLLYLDQVDFKLLAQEKPPLNVTNYPFRKMNVTDTVKTMYFILQNGAQRMEDVGILAVAKIISKSIEQIKESQNALNITTYVSIGVLTVILVFIVPMLFKLCLSHFQVLKFMLSLSLEQLEAQITRCNEYARIAGEDIQIEVQAVEDSPPSPTKHQTKDKVADEVVETMIKQPSLKHENNAFSSFDSGNKSKKVIRKSLFQQHSAQNKRKNTKVVKKMIRHLNVGGEDGLDEEKIHNSDKEEKKIQEESDDEDSESSKSGKEHHHSKHHNNKDSSGIPIAAIQMENAHKQKIQNIEQQVVRNSLYLRLQVLVAIALCMIYLNGALMISNKMSNDIFNNNLDATQKVRIFLKREVGGINLLMQMRQNLILNRTEPVLLYSNDHTYKTSPDGVAYYIKYCLDTEKEVTDLHRSTPPYFASAYSHLSQLASSSVCNITFSDQQTQQECMKEANGILMNGIDAAQSYLINQITQLDMQYKSVSPSRRTQEFLTEMINSPKMLVTTNLFVLYLEDIMTLAQREISISMVAFFAAAKQTYIMVFSLIISITCLWALIIGIFVYQRIKKRLTETQNILILFPLDEIEPEQRNRIEKYLNL